MPEKIIYQVKGSEPDPYIVKVAISPLAISCTCQAGENGLPCKHRKMILEGADPGIVEGDKSRLAKIAAAAAASGVFGLLKAYDEAKAQKKAIDDKADKAFRKYRDARVDLLMQRVKTDRAVVKARDGMEAAIESVISVYTAVETALGALRGLFIRPLSGE
jgi:uncharacterized Zn finger protein